MPKFSHLYRAETVQYRLYRGRRRRDRAAVRRQEYAMKLVSIRLITDDIQRLAGFYEQVTGVEANWATPDFAEIVTPAGVLAIGSTRTVALFGAGSARPADN